MIEPSDAERAALPDATAAYVAALEAENEQLRQKRVQSGRDYVETRRQIIEHFRIIKLALQTLEHAPYRWTEALNTASRIKAHLKECEIKAASFSICSDSTEDIADWIKWAITPTAVANPARPDSRP